MTPSTQSHDVLNTVLDHAPDYIFVLDRAGIVTYINRTRPDVTRAQVVGRPVTRFLSAHDRPMWKRRFAEVLRTGRSVSFEISRPEAKGGMRWFSCRLAPIKEKGRVTFAVCAASDITTHKNLERQLADSENYWRGLAQQSPDFLIVVDRALKIQYMNRLAKGFTMAEVIGTPFDAYLTPSSAVEARRVLRRVFRSGKPENYESRGMGDGGTLRWYSSSVAPIRRDGRIEQVIMASRDVTEASTLRARFEGVFNSSRDAMDYLSLDGTLMEVNPAYERLTGYSREELLHKKTIADLTPPEFRELDRRAMKVLLETGEPHEFEKEYIRKDGRRVPVRLTAFIVRGLQNRPTGFAAIIQDISERKVLEKEILETGAREQSKLGRDLHDTLGQTLTGLSMMAKSLRGKLGRRGGPGAAEAARLEALSTLAVRQARGLARGLLPAELESSGLARALRDLASNARDLFGIDCRAAIVEEIGLDSERAIQLYRIAQEAVHNAAKHSRSRGAVRLLLRRVAGGVLLEIFDEGIGIPVPARRGKGLGLRIMEHRARMIGATLSVRKGRRRGTVVSCLCPLVMVR